LGIKNCRSSVDPDWFYDTISRVGLEYSGPFKGIEHLALGDNQCLAIVEITDTRKCMPGLFKQPHVIHPASLDACFQSIFASVSSVSKELHLPTFIETLFVSADINAEAGRRLQVLTTSKASNTPNLRADAVVFHAEESATKSPMVVVSGFTTTSVPSNIGSPSSDELSLCCQQIEWVIDPDFLASTAAIDVCAVKLDTESSTPFLKVSSAYCHHVIRSSLDALDSQSSVMPRHHRMYQWMKDLALTHDQVLTIEEPLRKLQYSLKSFGPMGVMLSRIGDDLPRIIKAEIDPLRLMMQDDLLSQFYRQIGARCNAQIGQLLTLLLQKSPGMRILEIGAGTGGTTLSIFETIKSLNIHTTDFGISTYDFTDVSPAFFAKATELLKPWGSILHFKKLDIEKDPVSQEFENGSYDLIIAFNVLHATHSIGKSLANVRRLLCVGGKIILGEVTDNALAFQVIFGTLPGWWYGKRSLTVD
jgi:SAM-dependent methyltransferase